MANAPSFGVDGQADKTDLPDVLSENLPAGLICRSYGCHQCVNPLIRIGRRMSALLRIPDSSRTWRAVRKV
jgi:hypothetical protein